jgi:MFS transporter, ACS family, tartrate transporter
MSSTTMISATRRVVVDRDDSDLARATMWRVTLRLLPFVFALFVCNIIDRTNVAIAALQMNHDLGLSATAYGFGAGIFFAGYVFCEVPSNLFLARFGARRWIARIMISWGLIASAMMFVRTPLQFYLLRFLLGVAEAGFFPGIIYYLSLWFPSRMRGVAMARFMIAMPLAGAIGNPLGGWLLGLDGRGGLHGWQWLFFLEGIPAVLLGFATLAVLTDQPEDARWLSGEQRDWLTERLRRDGAESAAPHGVAPLRALAYPMIWLLSLPHLLMAVPLYAYTFWAPLIIRDALHTSAVGTGLIVGVIACASATAMLIAGAHSDRTGERCLHAGAGAMLTALGCVGAALLRDPLGQVAGLAFVEIGVRVYNAPFWCLPPMLLRGSAAAAGIALVNAIANVGGFIGPYAIGWFKDATGSTSGAFLMVAAMSLAAAAALAFVLRRQAAFASPAVSGASPLPLDAG